MRPSCLPCRRLVFSIRAAHIDTIHAISIDAIVREKAGGLAPKPPVHIVAEGALQLLDGAAASSFSTRAVSAAISASAPRCALATSGEQPARTRAAVNLAVMAFPFFSWPEHTARRRRHSIWPAVIARRASLPPTRGRRYHVAPPIAECWSDVRIVATEFARPRPSGGASLRRSSLSMDITAAQFERHLDEYTHR